MRSDIGMTTIAQRVNSLRALTPAAPPPPAAAATSGAGSFADALSTQVEAQTGFASAGQGIGAGAVGGAGGLGAGAAGAYGGVGYGGAGGAVNLGPGVQLNPAGAQIAPQFPGAGGIGGVGAAGGAVGGVGLAGAVGAPAAVQGTPTGTRTGPPAELQAYGNGRIPAAALQPLGIGDHSLWGPAARAYTDLAAAAARDGVTIGVNSSYRSYEEQQQMVDRYGLYSQGGRAASPGSSNHGWGLSIDLQLDDQAQAWMRANAGQFGFVEDVPREPWHWTFTAASY